MGIHVLPAGDSHRERARYRRRVARPRARSLLFDAVVAWLALVVSLGAMGHGGWNRDDTTDSGHPLDVWGVSLAVVMALPLVARRLAPVPVLAVVATATGTLYGLGYGFPPVAFAIALYTVARWPDRTPQLLRNTALVGSVAVLLVPSVVRSGFGPGVFAGPSSGRRLVPRRPPPAAPRAGGGRGRAGTRAERDTERERRLASRRGAHADRPRPPRLGRPRDQRDPRPGRRRAAAAGAGSRRAREPRSRRSRRSHARRSTRSTSSCACSARTARTGVEPPAGLAALDTLVERHRAAGLAVERPVDGERRALAAGRRPGGLPDPPGGADQRRAPRRRAAPTSRSCSAPTALELTVDNPAGATRPRRGTATASSACASAPRSLGGTLDARVARRALPRARAAALP